MKRRIMLALVAIQRAAAADGSATGAIIYRIIARALIDIDEHMGPQ